MTFRVFVTIVFLFISFNSFGATQEIQFQRGPLNFTGKFPFNPSKKLIINGYDDSGKPYNFTVLSKAQSKNIYVHSYQLSYLGQKSSGRIIIEVGQQGFIESRVDGQASPELKFSILIAK